MPSSQGPCRGESRSIGEPDAQEMQELSGKRESWDSVEFGIRNADRQTTGRKCASACPECQGMSGLVTFVAAGGGVQALRPAGPERGPARPWIAWPTPREVSWSLQHTMKRGRGRRSGVLLRPSSVLGESACVRAASRQAVTAAPRAL